MKKFKHLSPELQEQYSHWSGVYLQATQKKRNILFAVWFAVLLVIGIVNILVTPKALVLSLLFFLWSMTGLVVTLIDQNKRMAFIEGHVFEKQLDEAEKANEEN